MRSRRQEELTRGAPARVPNEEPKVLQVLTASRTYPDPASLPAFAWFRPVLFDERQSNRDRRESLFARLIRLQSGFLGRPIARGARREDGRAALLARVLREERPRLLHCFSLTAAVAALVALEAADPVPLVVSLTGSDLGKAVRSRWWAPRTRRVFQAAAIVTISGAGSAGELTRLGCPARKLRVLRAAVDVSRVPPRGPRGDAERSRDPRLRVLFCGPLVGRQGIAFTLEAAARLAGRPGGLLLRLLGEGPLLRPARALAAHLGIRDQVEIPGRGKASASHDAFLRALAESDVFVCPSITAADGDREAGPPPALLLAQAAALPVVATRHADLPEAVIDARTGYVVEERDVEGLVTALARVRNDPEFARSMGLAGRARVEKEHDARKVNAELEAIYLGVLGVAAAEEGV